MKRASQKKRNTTPSEVRTDEIHDRFVIIAPKRHERPHDLIQQEDRPVSSQECPFCQDEVLIHTTPLYQDGPKGKWHVKVIQNKFPAVSPDFPKAYGYQEVVLETPRHNKEFADLPIAHIERILRAYIERTRTLAEDKKIKYVLIFKNKGGKAGASLVHAHSQIFAAGFLPPHIVDKLTKAQQYRITNGVCYYCHLLSEEEKGPRHILSDDHTVVFAPYASIYNYETWIIPRHHHDNISQLNKRELRSLARALKHITSKLDEEQIPYNFYLHQAITDEDEHFYLRICPRRSVWAGVELGSRLIINSVSPEDAAAFYRNHTFK